MVLPRRPGPLLQHGLPHRLLRHAQRQSQGRLRHQREFQKKRPGTLYSHIAPEIGLVIVLVGFGGSFLDR